MQAAELVIKVARDLNDYEEGHEHTRWKADALLGYLSDAMCAVVLLRPDAYSVTAPVLLTTGSTKQNLPPGGARFLSIVRNMGSDGQTPGLPVTPVSRDDLDAANQEWHIEGFSSVIDHFVYDDTVPTVFYVSPPPAAGVYVDVSYARIPPAISSMEAELPVNAIWAEPLREYMMYRAYSRNDASGEDMAKGERHLSRYYLVLGEEAKAKLVFSPNFQQEQGR
ncbi:MAG: hypothetical protein RDU24_11695 [Humidesulfovibrio sp.]|uniref:phage adaptor protein n=1 Tax=Humidesulfovibrio sp. TaxID=2910988 RepID=UPI0027F1B4F0|nr:DUF6682 family protein [Humidesulfovibrio sp.]MDQ7836036.1 hypothetical protein [Humidesulfovibrio sp.]